VKSGKIEGQSISTIEVVKPRGRSGAVDLSDCSPSLILVTVEGHPSDVISGIRESEDRGFRGREIYYISTLETPNPDKEYDCGHIRGGHVD
jgi:hypothetical protein